MKTMRQRILGLLDAQRQATSAEIARALGLPAANVRYHLKILEDEGAVQIIGDSQQPGPGRPKRLYATSRQVQQHNFDALSAALLDYYLHNYGEAELQRLLPEIAQRLLQSPTDKDSRSAPAAAQTSPPTAGKALTSRLVSAVQRLNALHYQARWEAHPLAPRIIFAHCPYRTLVENHPQLCLLDAVMLQILLESPVKQLEKLAKDRRGLVRCVFSSSAG